MVAQKAAAQQAARTFLTLLREVQSSAAVHERGVPSHTAYNRQEWRVQKAGRGHIPFELEDAIPGCQLEDAHAPTRKGVHGSESVALLSGHKGFSSSSAGLPQHSVSGRPAPLWQ